MDRIRCISIRGWLLSFLLAFFFSGLEQQEPGAQKKNHYSLGRKNPPTHIVPSSATEQGRLRMPGPGLEKNT